MDERRHLLLAYAIAEWASALEHLRAVGRLYPLTGSSHTIEMELSVLIDQWHEEFCSPDVYRSPELIIREARAYLTEHQTELDQLLAAEGG